LIIKSTGILTVEQIENWLISAKTLSPVYVGMIISTLLFADLFIAVPTLTIIILSGYFLGFTYGAISSITGVLLAGICGYILSSFYGERILTYLIKNNKKRENVVDIFNQHGVMMILLSRAMPIFPETTACLSGMTKMGFRKFLTAWIISSVPYALIASYAGSISSLENPKPAIFTAIGLSMFFWSIWFFYHKKFQTNIK